MITANHLPANALPGGEGRAAEIGAPMAQVKTLLADAAMHYRETLRASPEAVAYLRGRGISGGAAARFGLGFAAPKWHGLAQVLRTYDDATILASGLQVLKDGADARRFDFFRGRVMFPIRDRRGSVVGFGGRVLEGGSLPKYMNSPESAIFKKRALLYGLFEAQGGIEDEGMALVVEGYLDVVALSQAGFHSVVGTLGTACTRTQITELLSLTRRLVFCFDGDAAGRRAAAHVLETVLPFASDAYQFQFMFLPGEHDPDSFVRVYGVEAFRALFDDVMSLSQFIQDRIVDGCQLEYAEGKSQCLARAKPLWLAMPEGQQSDVLLNFCAAVSGLSADEVHGVWTDAY